MAELGSESEPQIVRKQWHPVLVDGLRHLMGDRLRIEPEHAVAALPTRIDVLVISRPGAAELGAPYDRLRPSTLVEVESPGDWATWRSLRKLYADAALYGLDQDAEDTAQIGLWLVASRISAELLRTAARQVGPLEKVGPGLWEGHFVGSPLLIVHLHELPLTLAALPLLMVYRGPREAEIARVALDQGVHDQFFAEQAVTFHPRAVQEVLRMKGMNVEAYRQLANVRDIVALFGPRILIEEIGPKEVIRALGEERVREVLEELAREKANPPPGDDAR